MAYLNQLTPRFYKQRRQMPAYVPRRTGWERRPAYGLGAIDTGLWQPLTESELEQKMEALVRAAALKEFREVQTLGALAQAGSDYNFDRILEQRIESAFVEGLAMGELYEVTEPEFEQELMTLFATPQLNGFFKSITKALKKVIKAPLKLEKKIFKKTIGAVKKVAKKATAVVKKVAPMAAVAAAAYFGGPYGVAALKKFGPMIGAKIPALGKLIGMGPAGPPPSQIDNGVIGPNVTNGGVEIAQAMLAQQGVQMQSPEAELALRGYIQQQQARIAQQQPRIPIPGAGPVPPRAAPKTDMTKLLLPIGAGAAALLLAMR